MHRRSPDELVQKFMTLKDYVASMDPDEYFLINPVGQDSYSSNYNEIYMNLRTWLQNAENTVEANGYKVPDDQRETFEQELLDWDSKLADPMYFGKVYSIGTEGSKIVLNRTYTLPVKVYEVKQEQVTTPLGNTVTINVPGEESEWFKTPMRDGNSEIL